MSSLAASIPPELFRNILVYVGDEYRLGRYDIFDTTSSNNVSAVAAGRDEMRHLSTCASACVYWAQLARKRMFKCLVLRSSKDISGLLFLPRAPQSSRIVPIRNILGHLDVIYTLCDLPCFHSLAGLKAYYRITKLRRADLYITGPARPTFIVASIRRSVLHPLSFATPRVLPVKFSQSCGIFLHVENIHLPNPTVLFNLLQDCLSLHPQSMYCTNLIWDCDPAVHVALSSNGLTYAYCIELKGSVKPSGCTDDVLVATMVNSIPYHELSRRHQGPHLDPPETSCLFDVMRTKWSGPSTELEQTRRFEVTSDTGLLNLGQETIAVRLPPGTDFQLRWTVDDKFVFKCIASRLPGVAATDNDIRNVTYIIISLPSFDHFRQLGKHVKPINIDWGTLLCAVLRFPHLRQIAIQCTHHSPFSGDPYSHPVLAEFVAHLGEAWRGLGSLVGLYYGNWMGWKYGYDWVHVQLDTMLDEVNRKRAEPESQKTAASELESSAAEE